MAKWKFKENWLLIQIKRHKCKLIWYHCIIFFRHYLKIIDAICFGLRLISHNSQFSSCIWKVFLHWTKLQLHKINWKNAKVQFCPWVTSIVKKLKIYLEMQKKTIIVHNLNKIFYKFILIFLQQIFSWDNF